MKNTLFVKEGKASSLGEIKPAMLSEEKKWVIVFLIYADFRSEDAFSMDKSTKTEINILLQDIMTCPVNRRAEVYVILDSIQYVRKTDTCYEIDERVLLYEVKAAPGYPVNAFGRVVPIEHNTVSPRHPAELGHALQRVDKLTKVLKQITPGEEDEVFLVTWDHGSAFGIFRQIDPVTLPGSSGRSSITEQLDDFPYLKLFWTRALAETRFGEFMRTREEFSIADRKVGADTPPEILKNGELAQVLKSWLGKRKDKKAAVLLMMNCWMMNLHTLYSLRDYVKYLVAPEGYIDTPGYNYRDILTFIYQSSPLPPDAETLAVKCVQLSHNAFMRRRARTVNTKFPDTIDFRTIVAVQLDYPQGVSAFEELLKTAGAIIQQLTALLQADTSGSFLHLLSFVRALSFDFTDNEAFLIDLPNFFQSLLSATNLVRPDMFPGALFDQISSFTGSTHLQPPAVANGKFVGKCYTFFVDNNAEERWKLTGMPPTGFSLFFPTSATINNPDLNLLDNVRSDELLNGPFKPWTALVNKLLGR